MMFRSRRFRGYFTFSPQDSPEFGAKLRWIKETDIAWARRRTWMRDIKGAANCREIRSGWRDEMGFKNRIYPHQHWPQMIRTGLLPSDPACHGVTALLL